MQLSNNMSANMSSIRKRLKIDKSDISKIRLKYLRECLLIKLTYLNVGGITLLKSVKDKKRSEKTNIL